MDCLFILARKGWQLKRAISVMNRGFALAGLVQHSGKTWIGRIQSGFNCPGYQYDAQGLKGSCTGLAQYTMRLHRLYEQARAAE